MAQKTARKAIFSQSDTPVGISRHACRSISTVMRALQSKFGAKAALQIALRADVDQRSAERWLSRAAAAEPSAASFAKLLCSDAGGDVLAALMGPEPEQWPDWYRRLNKQMRLSSLRRDLVAQRRALEALEQEGDA